MLSPQRSCAAYLLYVHNLVHHVRVVDPFGSGHPTMLALPRIGTGDGTGVSAEMRYFILTDAYLKELPTFRSAAFRRSYVPSALTPLSPPTDASALSVPIRLIDLSKQREVWIAEAVVAVSTSTIDAIYAHLLRIHRRDAAVAESPGLLIGFYDGTVVPTYYYLLATFYALIYPNSFRHDSLNHWRCDPHVTVDREGRRIAFNSLVDGNRQVYVDDSAIVMGQSLLNY